MRKIALCLSIVLFSTITYANTYYQSDQSYFADLHWRLIGPFRGGRVLAVTGIPNEPKHYYFGSVNGGVWETQDAGRTWQPIFDDMPIASIGAIAIAPSDSNVIYVGSGEADMRSDIGYGNGMYKSVDGGASWKHIGLADSHQIGKILIDSKNPQVVFVAVLGHAYGPNEERGVFRSTDGGNSWQKILYKDANTGAIDLAFGKDEQTIFASLWQTRRPPWNVYPPSYGPGSGLYKSTDGGNHWTQITGNGFPSEGLGRIGIAVAPKNPNIVYALVDAKAGGMYRSDDEGVNWKHVSSDERIYSRGWYFGGVTIDPKNPDIVYVCDVTMYQSTDGGKIFSPFRGAPGGDDYHILWINPNDSNFMIAGVDQGTIITLNGGKTWSSWYNQPTGQFYHVITDNRFPYWVYGAQQDSGAAGVPSRTIDRTDGINIMQFHEITAGYENGYIAPDPVDPEIIFGGAVTKLDLRTEQTENVDPTFAYPDIYRQTWTLPLVFSPRDPNLLYFSNQYLFRTNDKGKHWTVLSPDLTRKELTIPPNLDPSSAQNSAIKEPRRGVIYAIAPSPVRDHLIWAGTDDGLIWITNDEGEHWQDVTPKELTPWSKVGIIEASHFDADTAYAAIDRHRLEDYKPYLYRTHDGGKTWKLIAEGIPDGEFVNVVREDEKKPHLLYAGTELGIYVSFDDGDHWQTLHSNLPVTSIRDIDVHDDDLVIGTHGRAFWIMDNITPLRQIDDVKASSDAFLYKPAMAYRIHLSGFTGSPLPKDESIALNPPDGAMIDYYIGKGVSSPVTLEILDQAGKLVRKYSSEDKTPVIDSGKITVTPNWFHLPATLSTEAGMHRFIWDLHEPFPDELKEGESKDGTMPAGVWSMPGDYTAKLTVNGHSYQQKFTVKNDPRINLSETDLMKQYEFAKQIQAKRLEVSKTVHEVKSLLKQAEELRTKSSGKIADKISAFENAITDLTEYRANPIGWGKPGSAPAKSTSFYYLSSAFSDLQQAIDSADAAPTVDAVSGFEKQSTAFGNAMDRWEKFKSDSLPELNKALQQNKLGTLKP